MHETGIVQGLVKQLEKIATAQGASRVSKAQVWLGALSQFSPEHFREHFEEAARGTVAETATLQMISSEDLSDPNAQQVVLREIELELDDAEGEGEGE